MRASGGLATLLVAGALLLAPACGLILGAGDYQVESGATGSTGNETSASSSTTGVGGSVAGVVVTPKAPTLLGGSAQAFAAAIDGTPSTDVTWSVVEPSGGMISAAGVYRASSMDGTYHVRATSNADASAFGEAEVVVKSSIAGVAIASGGGLVAPTGFGTQSHLGFSRGTGDWYAFYQQPDGTLQTSSSKDFVSWTPLTPLSLPNGHSGDGRDLSVASAHFGDEDVIHITLGDGSFGRYHIRGTLAGFDVTTTVNTGGDTSPDGCVTAVLEDGTVIDVSGWQSTPQTPPLTPCGNGDVDVFVAKKKEDGTSFMGVGFNETVVWCVNNHVNAHALLAIGSTALILYEDGVDDSAPVNVLMTIRKPDGTWLPIQDPQGSPITPPSVFASSQSQGLNDWTATVAGSRAHAVRHLGTKFEHRTFVLGGGWSDGAPIPDEDAKPDGGLFLAPYGEGLVLVSIQDLPGNLIRYTTFDGSTWAPWATLVNAGGARSFLSGYAPFSGSRPAILWTEGGMITGALLP
ncbi:MAG: hypothetical protein U0414_07870 [Polyangiaceae bacterium]